MTLGIRASHTLKCVHLAKTEARREILYHTIGIVDLRGIDTQ